MKRKLYDRLLEWKSSPSRKPLILEGARQVGKTWLLKEFGRNEYKNMVYINCHDNHDAKLLFQQVSLSAITAFFHFRIPLGLENQKIISSPIR